MIINKTTNKIISKKEIVCKNFLSQARGLMFRKKNNLMMEFSAERKICLHMLFVFYPLDVLILNEKKEVVEIKRNFRPFTFWNSREKGKYVLELAFSGQYKINDQLKF